jgi:hypothetical protein
MLVTQGNNERISSIYTRPLNYACYSGVSIDFDYIAMNLDDNKDKFHVEYRFLTKYTDYMNVSGNKNPWWNLSTLTFSEGGFTANFKTEPAAYHYVEKIVPEILDGFPMLQSKEDECAWLQLRIRADFDDVPGKKKKTNFVAIDNLIIRAESTKRS